MVSYIWKTAERYNQRYNEDMDRIELEVCCGSAEDAIEAGRGGAKRVELNSDLFQGGLTPSVGSLKVIKKENPDLKVMCMVRPREGGFCYTATEFSVMLEDTEELIRNGADGIVFGILKEDGTIDVERCRIMLEKIGNREKVFHRAIDVVPDVFKAMDELIKLGFTRILTSGQESSAPEGARLIKQMAEYADGRIEILPGCGVRPGNAALLCEQTGVRTVHASVKNTARDTSAMGNPRVHFSAVKLPEEDCYNIVRKENVADFLSSVNGAADNFSPAGE